MDQVSPGRAYAVLLDKRTEEIEEEVRGRPLRTDLVERFEQDFEDFVRVFFSFDIIHL